MGNFRRLICMNLSPVSPALPGSDLGDMMEMAPGDAIFRELFEGAPIGMAVLALD